MNLCHALLSLALALSTLTLAPSAAAGAIDDLRAGEDPCDPPCLDQLPLGPPGGGGSPCRPQCVEALPGFGWPDESCDPECMELLALIETLVYGPLGGGPCRPTCE